MGYLHNSQLPILKHLNPMYFNTYPHQLGTGIQTHCSCDTKNIASTCAKKTRLTTHKGDNYLLYYHRYHNRNKIIGINGSVYGSIIKLFNCCGRYSKYRTLMRLIKYSVFAQRNSQVILFKFVVNRTFIVTVPNASD